MNASLPAPCPACARPRAAGDECPHCGVIYARWRGRHPPMRAPARFRLSLRERERLFARLATAEEAGISPAAILEPAGEIPADLAGTLRADRLAGVPLARSLGDRGIVEGADLAFLQAGETRGALAATLRQLERRVALQRRERGRILLALAYPTLLALALVVLLPLPLLVREGPAAWAARVVPPLGAGALAAVFVGAVLPRLRREAWPRRVLRGIGLLLPGTSHALRDGSAATFLEVLGGCVAAGLPIRQAIPLAADAAPHPAFRSDAPILRLDAGASLAEAIAALGVFPPATVAAIAQGEIAGALDAALPAAAATHRRRAAIAAIGVAIALGLLAGAAVLGAIAWSVIDGWRGYLRTIEEVTAAP